MGFGIDGDGMVAIMGYLRDKTYSNKEEAVVREYSTNAADANTENGLGNRPILVTLPTVDHPHFKVRDYGKGLSREDIESIYRFYGASTKRQSNEYNGMLGIGSKAGFAYGDSFLIKSWCGDQIIMANAIIGEDKKGDIKIMDTLPNDTGETGVEITVPVRRADYDTFWRCAERVYKFFKVTPEFTNENFKIEKGESCLFESEDWKVTGYRTSYVVMGNVAYPVNVHQESLSKLSAAKRSVLEAGIEIEVPIGAVNFALSREALEYDSITIRAIDEKLEEVVATVKEKAQKTIDECETIWDAKIAYKKLITGNSSFTSLYKTECQKWNGQDITSTSFYFDRKHLLQVTTYDWCGAKVRRSNYGLIHAEQNGVVIVNDGVNRGALSRVRKYLQDNPFATVYLVSFKEPMEDDKPKTHEDFGNILKESGYETLPYRMLSPMEKAKPQASTKKFKIFKFDKAAHVYNRRQDSFWSEAEIIDEGDKKRYYVVMDRFMIRFPLCVYNPLELHRFLDALAISNMPFKEEVYGLRPAAITKHGIKDDPNWIELFTHLKPIVQKNIDQGNYGQLHGYEGMTNEFSLSEQTRKVGKQLGRHHIINRFHKAKEHMQNVVKKGKYAKARQAALYFGINIPSQKSDIPLDLYHQQIHDDYPVLTIPLTSYGLSSTHYDILADYVRQMDEKKLDKKSE